jgi:hypothetical protein
LAFLAQTHSAMVFERINPSYFEQCFRVWVQSLVEKLGVEVVAIDGKSLKGSYDRKSKLKALDMISAWSLITPLSLRTKESQ